MWQRCILHKLPTWLHENVIPSEAKQIDDFSFIVNTNCNGNSFELFTRSYNAAGNFRWQRKNRCEFPFRTENPVALQNGFCLTNNVKAIVPLNKRLLIEWTSVIGTVDFYFRHEFSSWKFQAEIRANRVASIAISEIIIYFIKRVS